jgi:hypothetical protein
MATKPSAVEIRSYQVGFGDCFLLSFVYPGNVKRHVLIDFGTSGLPGSLKPSTYMPLVAADIKEACGGKLAAVVATHRHLDHISGFATDNANGQSGTVIAACVPDVVLQPWTEDPKAATDARQATVRSVRSRQGFVAGLAAMHQIAQAACDLMKAPPATMTATVIRQLRFIGATNIKNQSAVENLISMGARTGATPVWARHGSSAEMARVLPGVKVHVLGPPDLTQSEKIRKMRTSDPDEFWTLVAGPSATHGQGIVPLARPRGVRSLPDVPPEARWFRDRLAKMTGDQLLEIVRVLDAQMNNTSLILLFEVGGKKLLFSGDAQIENWSYALQDASTATATRKLLAGVDLYKVGHHGSRNATPKKLLWERFQKRGKGARSRLVAMLSTMPGKHAGVPRPTLLEALKTETTLTNTDTRVKGVKGALYQQVVIPL